MEGQVEVLSLMEQLWSFGVGGGGSGGGGGGGGGSGLVFVFPRAAAYRDVPKGPTFCPVPSAGLAEVPAINSCMFRHAAAILISKDRSVPKYLATWVE